MLRNFLQISSAAILLGLFINAPAAAYDEKKAGELLDGGWQSVASGETWVFDSAAGKWQQFVGAKQFDAGFKLSSMPANLVRITSSSGRNYIVHFDAGDTIIRVFLEGVDDVPFVLRRIK